MRKPNSWDLTVPWSVLSTSQYVQGDQGSAAGSACYLACILQMRGERGEWENKDNLDVWRAGKVSRAWVHWVLDRASSAGLLMRHTSMEQYSEQQNSWKDEISIWIVQEFRLSCKFRRNTLDYCHFHTLKLCNLLQEERTKKESTKRNHQHACYVEVTTLVCFWFLFLSTLGRKVSVVPFQQLQFFCLAH